MEACCGHVRPGQSDVATMTDPKSTKNKGWSPGANSATLTVHLTGGGNRLTEMQSRQQNQIYVFVSHKHSYINVFFPTMATACRGKKPFDFTDVLSLPFLNKHLKEKEARWKGLCSNTQRKSTHKLISGPCEPSLCISIITLMLGFNLGSRAQGSLKSPATIGSSN